MSNLNTALRIGTSGMQMSQLALSTVSNNVVNANTEGYSRQVINTVSTSSNGFGNGVELDSIQRMTDSFLSQRVLTATSDLAYSTARSSYLSTIDGSVTNATAKGSLEAIVGDFLTSFNSLANAPSDTSLRRTVVQDAQLVADTLNGINTDLNTLKSTVDTAITSDLTSINQTLKDIFQLNTQIANIGGLSNGSNANDLQDARDRAITTLSAYFKVNVSNNTSNGALRLTTENGRVLVDEASYVQLTRTSTGGTYQGVGAQTVKVDGSLNSTIQPINTDTLTTGKIKALVDVRDTTLPNILAQVDEFATTFMSAVNDLTSQGTSSPAVRSLTSGNTSTLTATSTNLLTHADFSTISGAVFNISVVDVNGNPIRTTVGGTSITVSPTFPATTFSLDDLAAAINTNASIGNTALGGSAGVTATTGSDASGKPIITITAANSSYKVILDNVSGNALGLLGMNNMFTGASSQDMAVSSSMLANPDLLPVSRMRDSDGGLSSTNAENALALAQLANTNLSFGAAGGLGAQTDTPVGYMNQVVSNLAVTLNDAKNRQTYNESVQTQAQELAASVSGVNLNEELSEMIVYQNSFQASARIITVVNQMMQDLMNIL